MGTILVRTHEASARVPSRPWPGFPRLASVQDTARSLIVSVALCTYNGARFVAEQVRSILAQSSPADQIVISDDGSTDATLDVVRAELAAAGAAPHEVIILENPAPLGVTRNFEQAVLACTGDLIVLSDQDDLWIPDRLARAVKEFAARPDLLLLHGDARLVDEAGGPLGHSLFEAIEFTAGEQREVRRGHALDVLLRRNVVTGATVVFRRSLLDVASPFPDAWVHDEWLAIIAAISGAVDFIDAPLIDYRQHGSNEIGAARPTMAVRTSRLREPRLERNRRLLARAEALQERVVALGDAVPDAVAGLVRQKVAHERFRSALPRSRMLRLVPILRAAASGSYRRFGRAHYDILRDLVQPEH